MVEVHGDADLRPLLHEDHADLLIGLVALAHQQGELERADASLGKQGLCLLDVAGGLVRGIVELRGGVDDGAGGRGVAEGDGVHELLGVGGQVEGLAHLGVSELLALAVQRQPVHHGGGVSLDADVGVAFELHQAGEGQVGSDVDVAALQLDDAGRVVGDNLELDGLGEGLALNAVVGVGLKREVLALLPLGDGIGAGAEDAVVVLVGTDLVEVSLALNAQGEDAEVGQRGGSLFLGVDDDGGVVGALDVVEVLDAHVPAGVLGLDGAGEGPLPVLGGNGGAVGEEQALLHVEGVGLAVFGDFGHVGGQARLDGGAVVGALQQAVEDEVEDEDVLVARAGDGIEVIGVDGAADDDLLGRVGVGDVDATEGGQGAQGSRAEQEIAAAKLKVHVCLPFVYPSSG